MGVFDKKEDDIIEITHSDWNGESCQVRTVVLVEDFEWIQNQLVVIKQQSSHGHRRGAFQREQEIDIQAQTGAADRLWVFRMMRSWTFTRNGRPVELTLQAVKQLPQNVLNHIYNEIMKRQPKEETAEQGEETEEETEDPTSIDVSDSTDGAMNREDRELLPGPGLRNYLTKS